MLTVTSPGGPNSTSGFGMKGIGFASVWPEIAKPLVNSMVSSPLARMVIKLSSSVSNVMIDYNGSLQPNNDLVQVNYDTAAADNAELCAGNDAT